MSVPDGIEVGDLDCSDGGWNLTEANTDSIRDDEICTACVKVQTYLGGELTKLCEIKVSLILLIMVQDADNYRDTHGEEYT